VDVRLPAGQTVLWDYAGPSGGQRRVRNCSVASATLTVGSATAIEVAGTVAVEVGG
jgi:hypothetical protein